jgi:hypothetical protein
MKRILLISITFLFLSCSKEPEQDIYQHPDCFKMTNRFKTFFNGNIRYYFDLKNHGVEEVTKDQYSKYSQDNLYCIEK